jgi:hypothetical protein
MPYFAVRSGNVFRCVLADDPTSACVIAVTQHINDEEPTPCNPVAAFQVAELGQSRLDNTYILADQIQSAGSFVRANQ